MALHVKISAPGLCSYLDDSESSSKRKEENSGEDEVVRLKVETGTGDCSSV